MVIKTTLTREQMKLKARAAAEKALKSDFFTNPKYKDPKGVTVLCGAKYRNQVA